MSFLKTRGQSELRSPPKSDTVSAFSHLIRRRPRRRSSDLPPLTRPPLLMRKKGLSRKKSPPHAVVSNPNLPKSPASREHSPSVVAETSGGPSLSPSHQISISVSESNALASVRAISKTIPQAVDLSPMNPSSNPAQPLNSAKPAIAADPVPPSAKVASATTPVPNVRPAKVAPTADPASTSSPSLSNDASWAGLFKGFSRRLEKKGTPFTLPSGEPCVKIPNSVIEKNRKSWEFFILGQFYSDPPAQGTIHAIANGIWSRFHRDISVTKMEGNAFLFRIPNAATRNRVLTQGLWQIDGQTMFVAKWEPGPIPLQGMLSP